MQLHAWVRVGLVFAWWMLASVVPARAQPAVSAPLVHRESSDRLAGPGWSVPAKAEPSLSETDWDLTMRIRAALLADPDLANHNLIVVVRGGLVEIDGPIPSASLRERVRQTVSAIPGVRQLRERLRIQSDYWSSRTFVRRLPPVDQPWRWDRLVAQEAATANSDRPSNVPALAADPHSPAPRFGSLLLTPPILAGLGQREPAFGSPRQDLPQTLALLEQHLRQQWRFRDVHVQLVGQTIHLTGTVATPEDLRELYHLLSRISPTLTVHAEQVQIRPVEPQRSSTQPR